MTTLVLTSPAEVTAAVGAVVTVTVTVSDDTVPVFRSSDGYKLSAKKNAQTGAWSAQWVTLKAGTYAITVNAGDATPVSASVVVGGGGGGPEPDPEVVLSDEAVAVLLNLTDSATRAAARTLVADDVANPASAIGGALSATFVPLTRLATSSISGLVELATTAETKAGTDTTRAVTPAAAKASFLSLGSDGLGASFEDAATSDQAFIIRSRHVGSTPIPVPTFQPNGPLASYAMGVDFMPKGVPGSYSTNGIVWLDVCSRDILNSNATPTVSARVGVFDDHVELGSRAFNGASNMPVYLCVGGVITANFKVDGTTEYTGQILSNKSTNAQYIGLTAQNTNAGTGAYAQAEVKGSNATLQLRTYSTGFTGSAGYANTSDVSATGTGGLALSTQSAAAPIHLIAGSTAKANAKITIDSTGVAFFGGATSGKRAATADASDLATVITLANALKADLVAYSLKAA